MILTPKYLEKLSKTDILSNQARRERRKNKEIRCTLSDECLEGVNQGKALKKGLHLKRVTNASKERNP